jgi:hypothetical protein
VEFEVLISKVAEPFVFIIPFFMSICNPLAPDALSKSGVYSVNAVDEKFNIFLLLASSNKDK